MSELVSNFSACGRRSFFFPADPPSILLGIRCQYPLGTLLIAAFDRGGCILATARPLLRGGGAIRALGLCCGACLRHKVAFEGQCASCLSFGGAIATCRTSRFLLCPGSRDVMPSICRCALLPLRRVRPCHAGHARCTVWRNGLGTLGATCLCLGQHRQGQKEACEDDFDHLNARIDGLQPFASDWIGLCAICVDSPTMLNNLGAA